MDSFGRENREDFEVLKDLVRHVNEVCYSKWRMGAGDHSQQSFDLMTRVKETIQGTEAVVSQLEKTPAGERLWQDTDFKIATEYRNGINLALNYLTEIETQILSEPDRGVY